MRFCIQCSVLTDDSGKAVSMAEPDRVTYSYLDAPDAAAAIRAAVDGDGHVLDRISQVDDTQAMATVRHGKSASMLHAFPEEEAEWRIEG